MYTSMPKFIYIYKCIVHQPKNFSLFKATLCCLLDYITWQSEKKMGFMK